MGTNTPYEIIGPPLAPPPTEILKYLGGIVV